MGEGINNFFLNTGAAFTADEQVQLAKKVPQVNYTNTRFKSAVALVPRPRRLPPHQFSRNQAQRLASMEKKLRLTPQK
jgi:hypothetical protein